MVLAVNRGIVYPGRGLVPRVANGPTGRLMFFRVVDDVFHVYHRLNNTSLNHDDGNVRVRHVNEGGANLEIDFRNFYTRRLWCHALTTNDRTCLNAFLQ